MSQFKAVSSANVLGGTDKGALCICATEGYWKIGAARHPNAVGNTSQQSQDRAACEMMLGLFDADFGRSRLAICEWTIKQRRAIWIQGES